MRGPCAERGARRPVLTFFSFKILAVAVAGRLFLAHLFKNRHCARIRDESKYKPVVIMKNFPYCNDIISLSLPIASPPLPRYINI